MAETWVPILGMGADGVGGSDLDINYNLSYARYGILTLPTIRLVYIEVRLTANEAGGSGQAIWITLPVPPAISTGSFDRPSIRGVYYDDSESGGPITSYFLEATGLLGVFTGDEGGEGIPNGTGKLSLLSIATGNAIGAFSPVPASGDMFSASGWYSANPL